MDLALLNCFVAPKWRLRCPQLGSKLEKYAILAEAPGTATTIITITTIGTITSTIPPPIHLLDKDKDDAKTANLDKDKGKDLKKYAKC